MDSGGGPEARQLPPQQRPVLLARRAQARRIAALREELPAAVDQLPSAGPEARPAVAGGGEDGDRLTRGAGQPVVEDRVAPAGEDGQRDQEPLEHPHQEEAAKDGHRPRHPQAPPARRSGSHRRRRLAGGGEGHRHGNNHARTRGVLRRRGAHGTPPGRHRHSRRRRRRAPRGQRQRLQQRGLFVAWIFLDILLLVVLLGVGAGVERWRQRQRRRVAGVAGVDVARRRGRGPDAVGVRGPLRHVPEYGSVRSPGGMEQQQGRALLSSSLFVAKKKNHRHAYAYMLLKKCYRFAMHSIVSFAVLAFGY